MCDKMGEKRYKIIYDRDACIGAASCAAIHPDRWQIDPENKAILIKGRKTDKPNIFEREIDDSTIQEDLDAAKSCPVNCIHIIDLKTKKQLI
jgi:ferredoxin